MDPVLGRFIGRDPVGLLGGPGVYCASFAMFIRMDPSGLDDYIPINPEMFLPSGGRPAPTDNNAGTSVPWRPKYGGPGVHCAACHPVMPYPRGDGPPEIPDGGAVGSTEFHFFVGGGGATVICKDDCGKIRIMTFSKLCIGGAIGASYSAMIVNMSGERCDPSFYSGWFYEAGVSVGIWGAGYDVGYGDFGHTGIESYIPGSPNGTVESGFGVGIPQGGMVKSTWCYYRLTSDIAVSESDGEVTGLF